MPWPTEIRLRKAANTLVIIFDDGTTKTLGGFVLRAHSPSAETQGHGGKKPDVFINPAVRVLSVEPVGNYAIRIHFDDGHQTGLYAWDRLFALGS